VAVDPGTGRVELLDYLVVEDVGRIVNPLTLHGQAIGGVVQGLGGAFMENLVYDNNGQLLTGSLADYLIPTAVRARGARVSEPMRGRRWPGRCNRACGIAPCGIQPPLTTGKPSNVKVNSAWLCRLAESSLTRGVGLRRRLLCGAGCGGWATS
jgi:Molybdopterin-binding domain of aldehyde dehydrogenase